MSLYSSKALKVEIFESKYLNLDDIVWFQSTEGGEYSNLDCQNDDPLFGLNIKCKHSQGQLGFA